MPKRRGKIKIAPYIADAVNNAGVCCCEEYMTPLLLACKLVRQERVKLTPRRVARMAGLIQKENMGRAPNYEGFLGAMN